MPCGNCRNRKFRMKKPEKFGDSDFLPTFAHANENHAEIAQLVERNLAKVEVAGPSPVFRSRVAKERRIARFSFLFFGGGRDSTPATSRRPFQGPGVSTIYRGRHSRYARVRVPFSAPEWQKKGESQDSSFFALYTRRRGAIADSRCHVIYLSRFFYDLRLAKGSRPAY